MTLWLMMLHNHTRFGDKMFFGLENIVQTNIHYYFEPHVTLTLNAITPFFFPQDIPAYDPVLPKQV